MRALRWKKWLVAASGLMVYQVAGCTSVEQLQTVLQNLLQGVLP